MCTSPQKLESSNRTLTSIRSKGKALTFIIISMAPTDILFTLLNVLINCDLLVAVHKWWFTEFLAGGFGKGFSLGGQVARPEVHALFDIGTVVASLPGVTESIDVSLSIQSRLGDEVVDLFVVVGSTKAAYLLNNNNKSLFLRLLSQPGLWVYICLLVVSVDKFAKQYFLLNSCWNWPQVLFQCISIKRCNK